MEILFDVVFLLNHSAFSFFILECCSLTSITLHVPPHYLTLILVVLQVFLPKCLMEVVENSRLGGHKFKLHYLFILESRDSFISPTLMSQIGPPKKVFLPMPSYLAATSTWTPPPKTHMQLYFYCWKGFFISRISFSYRKGEWSLMKFIISYAT